MSITKVILLLILALSLQDSHERLSGGLRQKARRQKYEKLKNKPRDELNTDELQLVESIERQDRQTREYWENRQKQLQKTPQGREILKAEKAALQKKEKVAKEVAERTAWAETPQGKKKIAAWKQEAQKAGWREYQWNTWVKEHRWADYDDRQKYISNYDSYSNVVQAARLGWKHRSNIDFKKEERPYY